ncbi:MAG: glycerol kinase [Myxococcales bacterium]|nr:glycerol kinase [Myxococcales bacterium]
MLILAIDQGTTGSTALLVDEQQRILAKRNQEFPQIYPQPAWVEHDPEAIWASVLGATNACLDAVPGARDQVGAIGITNQRETTVVWERASGRAIHNAIVWQCRRTAEVCAALKANGLEDEFRHRTGLVLDAYFSGTKIAWLLDHVNDARRRAEAGELAFGTIDSWLIHKITAGQSHVTDATNASRTLVANLATGDWDDWCLDQLNIPRAVLPTILDCDGLFGRSVGFCGLPDGTPIHGVLGDQQAALFGQACFQPGDAKCTYGTGAFLLANCGGEVTHSTHGLLATPAWRLGGQTTYALEGSTFIAGAAVQWLRDELQIIDSASEIEALASQVPDSGGVTFVPALAGLGAPHWRGDARGVITGLTRGSGRAEIARAVLDGIALQIVDLLEAAMADCPAPLARLRVDGGAAANNLLMQTQADLLNVAVDRPPMLESTGLGAALVAALGVGAIDQLTDLQQDWALERRFTPQQDDHWRAGQRTRWQTAVEKA